MPMPHQVQMQVIRRRLVGKEGTDRIRELRAILQDLPGYRNGPYADIRAWVLTEIDRSRVRSRVVHRDSVAVRRQGVAQVALVGAPNMGKSTLLQALSNVQVKTGDYPFTTLRPVAAVTSIHGLPVQLVEIPGLIHGATGDRGGGRALLGVLREADAVAFCHAVTAAPADLETVRAEVRAAGIERPALVAITKTDEAEPWMLERLRVAIADLPVVGVSILDDASLEAFRTTVWGLTGLMRIHTRRPGSDRSEPLAVPPGATVRDVAAAIHETLALACRGGRVWGASVRYPGQLVGRDHSLAEDDVVELVT